MIIKMGFLLGSHRKELFLCPFTLPSVSSFYLKKFCIVEAAPFKEVAAALPHNLGFEKFNP